MDDSSALATGPTRPLVRAALALTAFIACGVLVGGVARASHVLPGSGDCAYGDVYGPCVPSPTSETGVGLPPLPAACKPPDNPTGAWAATCATALRQEPPSGEPLRGMPDQCYYGGMYFDALSCLQLLTGTPQSAQLSTVPPNPHTEPAQPANIAAEPLALPPDCSTSRIAQNARPCMDALVRGFFFHTSLPILYPCIYFCPLIDPNDTSSVACGAELQYIAYHVGLDASNVPLDVATQFCELPDPGNLAGRNVFVTFRYGGCEPPSGEGGCTSQIEVQSGPLCDRHPALYGEFETGPTPYSQHTVRGVPAAMFTDDLGVILEIYTGTTTVAIFAPSSEVALSLAQELQEAVATDIPAVGAYLSDLSAARSSGSALPPPNAAIMNSPTDCDGVWEARIDVG